MKPIHWLIAGVAFWFLFLKGKVKTIIPGFEAAPAPVQTSGLVATVAPVLGITGTISEPGPTGGDAPAKLVDTSLLLSAGNLATI